MGTLLVVSNEGGFCFRRKENRHDIKVNFQFLNVNKAEEGKIRCFILELKKIWNLILLSDLKFTLNISITLCDTWDDCSLEKKVFSIFSKISFYILELLWWISGSVSFSSFSTKVFFLPRKFTYIVVTYIYKTWIIHLCD